MDKDIEYWDKFDPKYKELHQAINKAVNLIGWKDFYYAVLQYQKEKIKSNYQLKSSD